MELFKKRIARFARNTVDALKYVRKLKALGIGAYFEEQCLDSLKSESELALGIYSVLAQAESENNSANVRWGIQRRMQSGTFNFRYNLIGYRKGEDGQPEIVPEEAKYCNEIDKSVIWGNADIFVVATTSIHMKIITQTFNQENQYEIFMLQFNYILPVRKENCVL